MFRRWIHWRHARFYSTDAVCWAENAHHFQFDIMSDFVLKPTKYTFFFQNRSCFSDWKCRIQEKCNRQSFIVQDTKNCCLVFVSLCRWEMASNMNDKSICRKRTAGTDLYVGASVPCLPSSSNKLEGHATRPYAVLLLEDALF
jgi:hypothetical protein